MPQIPKHRKVKRAMVLLKRNQCMRNYPKYKSYKPLCEKLKNNNNSLAQALSKEKEEAQLLFSQNVALVAEVQDLGLACSKRDTVIANMLKNAKQMLEMLVTMTGYVTNTITMCQEFAATCGTNLQIPCNLAGTRESLRRLSGKTPAKGVVKPMVSGHTITRPTINLSRINTQYINPSNLSIIEEVSTTPQRNEELANARSPQLQSPITHHRYETGRTRRMPERLIVSSPRSGGENERRLSRRRSRYSTRMSGKQSKIKSSRLSGRHSSEFGENIGSPRVKLNDVSKLLQNSQSINIRLLSGNLRLSSPTNSEHRKKSEPTIPETSSDNIEEEDTPEIEGENPMESMEQNQEDSKPSTSSKAVNNSQNSNNSDWDDPLEGPSWLLNGPSFSREETGGGTPKGTFQKELEPVLSISASKRASQSQNNEGKNLIHETESSSSENMDSSDLYEGTTSQNKSAEAEALNKPPDKPENVPNFVTQRRVYFVNDDEEEDDFTLMYSRQPRNMNFNINDLKLPVLEESAIAASARMKEPEPEITATIQKITQTCPVPSLSSETLDESSFDHSAVKLPLLLNDQKDTTTIERRKRGKRSNTNESMDFIDSSPIPSAETFKERRRNNRDPSMAKVVLQKLNESDVKQRTPSPDEFSDSRQYLKEQNGSRLDNYSDSESSNASSSNSLYNSRPRRKKAPANFQEPNLRTKLRRHR